MGEQIYSEISGTFSDRKEDVLEQRTYYYARVSSTGQNLARQLEAFKRLGAQDRQIITDKQSGKDLNRPGYQALKSTLLRKGDTLVVSSLDRLSRNKADIKKEVEYFKEEGIRLKILDIPSTMTEAPKGQEWIVEMISNIIIEVLASFSEQERENIRKRQREGIDAKRHRPDWIDYGRPRVGKPDNWTEVISRWQGGEITAARAMQMTGVKRTTFYKLLKEERGYGKTL